MRVSDDSFQNNSGNGHIPVLLKETVCMLAPKDGGKYLDCTFGGGGHTRAILESADCTVVAIDRDPEAAKRAEKLGLEFGGRFEFHSAKFSQLDEFGSGYDGILFDFGVSSYQLDEAYRGFSINKEASLDMRMNSGEGESALDYLNRVSEFELGGVLREYGEEKSFRKVARAIIAGRECGKIKTTTDLAAVVASALPNLRGHIHPATKTFQALRIQVNDELGEIRAALPKAFDALKSGAVMAAISFHSLEDRIVKQFFKREAGRPESRADHSYVQDRTKRASLLTTKPIVATAEEIRQNPRSRSAKLRGLRKD